MLETRNRCNRKNSRLSKAGIRKTSIQRFLSLNGHGDAMWSNCNVWLSLIRRKILIPRRLHLFAPICISSHCACSEAKLLLFCTSLPRLSGNIIHQLAIMNTTHNLSHQWQLRESVARLWYRHLSHLCISLSHFVTCCHMLSHVVTCCHILHTLFINITRYSPTALSDRSSSWGIIINGAHQPQHAVFQLSKTYSWEAGTHLGPKHL